MAQPLSFVEIDHSKNTHLSVQLPKILFVGNDRNFSDRTLAVFRSEFTDFDFTRVADVSDVAITRRLHDDVRFVVFAADKMQSALDTPALFVDAVGSAKIIFSLVDPKDAAQFLAARGNKVGLGDVGFLPLNAQMDVWISIMHLFLCGQSFLPCEVADELFGKASQFAQDEEPIQSLTSREWEVLQLVAQGAQNKNIAVALELSVHTVKLHIHNMLKKIGVSNRTSAAGWFMQNRNAYDGTTDSIHG